MDVKGKIGRVMVFWNFWGPKKERRRKGKNGS